MTRKFLTPIEFANPLDATLLTLGWATHSGGVYELDAENARTLIISHGSQGELYMNPSTAGWWSSKPLAISSYLGLTLSSDNTYVSVWGDDYIDISMNGWAENIMLTQTLLNMNSVSITAQTNGVTRLTLTDTALTATVPVYVPDEAYGAGWNGSLSVPTKNAVYDKIETLGGGGSVDALHVGPDAPTDANIELWWDTDDDQDRQSINAQTGTTYTFVLADENCLVTFANATAVTATLPTNAVAAFPIGARIDIAQLAAGQVTVSGAGVTIKATPSATLRADGSAGTLIKYATDTWLFTGDLA